jgi:hypothetical protein
MRFYTSAAAHDYSRMSTVRGEVAHQSHPQNTQQRMKIKESIRKKKQRILANSSNEVTRKMQKKKAVKKQKGPKKVRDLKKKTASERKATKKVRDQASFGERRCDDFDAVFLLFLISAGDFS